MNGPLTFRTGESMEVENSSDPDQDYLLEVQSIRDAQLGWLRLLGNAVVRALRLEAARNETDRS